MTFGRVQELSRYHYDTRGWVVGRTLNPGTPGEESLFYIYDGARIAEQVDGDGDLVAAWDYGTYIDEPVAMHRDTDGDGDLDATWYYLQDDLYNVVGLVDAATGGVVERYTYDDYGTPRVWVEDGEGRVFSPSALIEVLAGIVVKCGTAMVNSPIACLGLSFRTRPCRDGVAEGKMPVRTLFGGAYESLIALCSSTIVWRVLCLVPRTPGTRFDGLRGHTF